MKNRFTFLVVFIFVITSMSFAQTYYVSTVGNDGSGNGSAGNPWLTIQHAVTTVSSGATINVAAGTYAGNINITKSLTILGDPGNTDPGPGINAPIIDGGSNPGSAFFIANGVSNVTIQGFEMRNFTSNDNGVGNGISAWVGSTSNITIQDNYFHNLGWNGVLVGNDYSSNPSMWGDHTNWTIKGNILETFETYGFELTNTSNSSIENNIIHSNATWNLANICIMVDARRNESGIVIQGNQIDGQIWPGWPAVYVFANSFETPNVNLNNVLIKDNIVSTSSTSAQIYVYNYSGTGTVTGVQVHNNSFPTNLAPFGLKSNTPASIDAIGNWWGNVTGPNNTTTNPSGTGNAVSDNVIYSPWWGANYINVAHPWNWITNTTVTIHSTISAASAGDIINVAAGTYNETIDIQKPLSLLGQGAATTIIDVSANSSAGNAVAIHNLTGNVMVDGFTIRTGPATSVASSGFVVGALTGTGLVTISNNVIWCVQSSLGTPYDNMGFYAYSSTPTDGKLVFDHNVIHGGIGTVTSGV